jgi:hypothetical protein
MGQITFSGAKYQNKKRKTRREIFLERMDKLIPWNQLEKKVAHYYPKGQNGRPPYPLSSMLRAASVTASANRQKCTKPGRATNGTSAVRPESRLYFCFAGYVHLTKPVVSPTVPYPDVRSR